VAKDLTTATESEDPNQTERAVGEREPAFQPPVNITRVSPMLHRSTSRGSASGLWS